MVYSLGVEQSEPGRWLTWVFGLPGCFSRGTDRAGTVEAAVGEIVAYLKWCGRGSGLTLASEPEVVIAEEFTNFDSGGGYWVNAFYQDDLRVLTVAEVVETHRLLELSRQDMTAAVRGIRAAELDEPVEGEQFGNIRGIIGHVAGAEWWYLQQLGLVCEAEHLPKDALEMLSAVRERTLCELPRLAGDAAVTESRRERWSARKVVRRTLWHERVHVRHIHRIASGLR